MKKILLASTILVGSTGIAAAQGIEFSGSAFMGVEWTDPAGVPPLAWYAKSSVSLDVAMSGETDGGLSFGADFNLFSYTAWGNATTVDHDWSTGPDDGGLDVWVSGDFGKVTLSADIEATAMTLAYEYSMDAFSIDVAYNIVSPAWDVEVGYDGGDWSVYLGHDTATGDTRLGGEYSVSDFTIGADLVNDSSVPELDWDISVGWSSGAVSVDVSLGADASAIGAGDYSLGLDVGYDLGGGASVDFSYDDPDSGTTGDETITLGISMDF